MPDIFLSYNREDQAVARRFAEAFEHQGFEVWWDATLRSGEAYDQVTEKALKEAKAVVVLWSKRSVESRWVRAEATLADRNKTLVPVMIEPCERPIMFELTHTADLSHWKGDESDKAWQSYLADVRRFVDKGERNLAVPPVAGRSRRISGMAIAIPAVLLIAGVVLWALLRTSGDPAAQSGAERVAPAPAGALAAPAGVTLAVLPFLNLSSDPEQEYFSDGLSEELMNQLAQIKDLRVTARTSSFAFKGKNEDLRVIGEKLGVGHILEGSVRKSGNQLRITAQLIDSRAGTHLWSQTYDRELNDVFAIQEEIAMAVSEALSITLDVGAMSRAKGGTTNLEAYDKYLRGRELDRRRGGPNDILQAAQFYREAVALDPNFVRAWSDLYTELTDSLGFVPENAAAARTEMGEVGARLVALAPDDWRTHGVRASQFMDQRQWAAAEAALNAARASGAEFRTDIANVDTMFVMSVGRINEVVPFAERSRQADPLALNSSYGWQIMLFNAGRPDEADAEYERSKGLVGDRTLVDGLALWRILARKDADPAAIGAQFRLYLQHEEGPTALDHVLADALDDKEGARAAIREAFEDPASQTASGMLTIAAHADHFDDKDLALAALRRSYVDLRGTNIGVLWRPFKNDLRADPRFKDILRDLGLADYFRASGKWGDFCRPVGEDDFECR